MLPLLLWLLSPGPMSARLCIRVQLYYGAVQELTSSDHKPVHAVFEAAVKTTIEDKRAAVSTDITRQLDAMENRTTPRVSLSLRSIMVCEVGGPAEVHSSVNIILQGAMEWSPIPRPSFASYLVIASCPVAVFRRCIHAALETNADDRKHRPSRCIVAFCSEA
jgi:hypothetical protein